MKKGTKIGIGATLLLLGVMAVSSCTQSFCSPTDTARIMYAFDPGLTRIKSGGTEDVTFNGTGCSYRIYGFTAEQAAWNNGGFEYADGTRLTYFNAVIDSAKSNGYVNVDQNTIPYYTALDNLVLKAILLEAANHSDAPSHNVEYNLALEEDFAKFNRDISKYSYMKFISSDVSEYWAVYNKYDAEVRETVSADICPSTDFINAYKSRMNSYASSYRTCLTTKEDKYGSYGYETNGVYLTPKTWGYAWSKGFFEGLLVYPIGWLIDQIVVGFRSAGATNGASALLGIIFVTLIVRTIMVLATFKSTVNNAKMNELQPEIQKIQSKYPNANTSQIEKQRQAEEMNRLYKKNKINPFTSILVMIIQFPIFICVWGALSGSAYLTTGSVLGLNLSLSIRDVLFTGANWGPAGNYAAVTALFLFLLMAGAQTISMLLPQWIQKRKAKQAAKLGKNPSQKSQNNQMKIFTYVMLAMIIFMGFSLVSAMGIYWFIGALFSVAQTLITQVITSRNAKKK